MEKRLHPISNTKHWEAKGPGTKPSQVGGMYLSCAGFLATGMCSRWGDPCARDQQPGLACMAMDAHPAAVGAQAAEQQHAPSPLAHISHSGKKVGVGSA